MAMLITPESQNLGKFTFPLNLLLLVLGLVSFVFIILKYLIGFHVYHGEYRPCLKV